MLTSRLNIAAHGLLLTIVLSAGAAPGATLQVRQDGSGGFTTIAAAIAAASPGDLIEIGSGTYPERLTVAKDLSLVSSSGPSATIIDGQGQFRGLSVQGAAQCFVQGLQFAHGSAGWDDPGQGGAIRVIEGSTLIVEGCWFIENRSAHDAGAIWAYTNGVHCTVSDSRFERNHADWNGGACGVSTGACLTLADCIIVDNSTDAICGGVAAYYATLQMDRCLLVGNRGQASGAIRAYDSVSTIRSNTIYDNSSPDRASVLFDGGGNCTLEFNIICGDRSGFGVEFDVITSQRDCNLYHGNARGAVAGGGVSTSEREGEPWFCNWRVGDFGLCTMSPALPEVNGCGLIGAYGLACDSCGPIVNESSSWGGVKAIYR